MAFEDPVEMVDLLANVKSALRQRGIYRVVFGADHGHFFPGIPEECTSLRNFLEIEGFEVEERRQLDVERDMTSYEVPAWVQPALDGVTIRRSEVADVSLVDEFLQETFPGRWRFDVLQRMVEEKRPEDIFLMEVDGSVQGFAFTQVSTGPLPIGGAVWHLDLGEKWGSLGPIGIGTAVRGRKLGHAMLAGALRGLRDAGVRQCIIDWTSLVDFYGAQGFEVTRTYLPAKLDLAK